jgi:polar amino acid transport system substrate-binding protein
MTHSRPRLTLAAAAAAALALAACGTAAAGAAPAPSLGQAVAPAAPAVAAVPPAPQDEVCTTAKGGDGLAATASVRPEGSFDDLRTAARAQLLSPGKNKLVVGTSADVKLWGARNPTSGQLEGFDVSLARAIAQALVGNPNAIEFRVINYNQRLPALGAAPIEGEKAAQPVDLVLHTMTINCARWKRIAFSTEYYHAGQKVIVRADNPTYLDRVRKHQEMQITDLPEGAQICVPDGSTNQEKLAADYKQFKAVPVPEIGECLVKFQKGQVDAITGDDTVLAGFAAQDPYAKVVGAALTAEPYGIGVNRRSVALLMFVNAVLDQLRTSPAGLKTIYDETMGQAVPAAFVPPKAKYDRKIR